MLSKNIDSGLKIKSIGLTDKDQRILEVAVELLNAHGITSELSTDDDTDINIIDAQTDAGRPFLTDSIEGKLNIFFCEEASDNSHTWLQRPVRAMSLYNTLNDALKDVYIKQALTSKQNDPLTAIKGERPQEDECQKEPKALFHYLLKAKMDKQSFAIENTNGFPKVLIDGLTGNVWTTATDDELIFISSFDKDELVVSPVTNDDMPAASDNLRMIKISTAIWKAALFNPYTEILDGSSTDTPVKLRSWPMFTRLIFLPFHVTLARLMTEKPRSLSEIQQLSGVPMQDVINFYNASLTAGLIIQTQGANEPVNVH